MNLTGLIAFSVTALRGHGLRTFLSLLGVAVGVISVILLTGLGEGARRYVIGEFQSLGSNLLIVLPGKVETKGGIPGMGGVPNPLTLDDALALSRADPRIQRCVPIASGTERVTNGLRGRDVPVLGVTSDWPDLLNVKVAQGAFLPAGDMKSGNRICVLGHNTARELFGVENPLGQAVRLGGSRYRVAGVLEPRGILIGIDTDELVLIPVGMCLKMFDKQSLFRIMIQGFHFSELDGISQRVQDIIKERHHDEEDITVVTQDAVLFTFDQVLTALTLMLVGIAAISLTVAGLGIMNVMLVSVSERTHEVGLLKALGATTAQVIFLFLAEAMIISAMGGLMGLALGYGTAWTATQYLDGFDIRPPMWAVIASLSVSVLVGAASGVVPARNAARLDPVTCLAKG